jgi:hypothetical protein
MQKTIHRRDDERHEALQESSTTGGGSHQKLAGVPERIDDYYFARHRTGQGLSIYCRKGSPVAPKKSFDQNLPRKESAT